jgi:hypothetical protein
VEKTDHPGEAEARLLIDEFDALLAGAIEFRIDVVGFETDVVHAFASRGQKLSHAGVIASGLEELDLGATDFEEHSPDALIFDDPVRCDFEAEGISIELHRFVGAFNDNANVVNLVEHSGLVLLPANRMLFG